MSTEWNTYLTEMDEIMNFLSTITSKDELVAMPKSVIKFLLKLLDKLKTKFQQIDGRLDALENP